VNPKASQSWPPAVVFGFSLPENCFPASPRRKEHGIETFGMTLSLLRSPIHNSKGFLDRLRAGGSH
jgi:hypothetical protein